MIDDPPVLKNEAPRIVKEAGQLNAAAVLQYESV
jgi:hypothetical protein